MNAFTVSTAKSAVACRPAARKARAGGRGGRAGGGVKRQDLRRAFTGLGGRRGVGTTPAPSPPSLSDTRPTMRGRPTRHDVWPSPSAYRALLDAFRSHLWIYLTT